MLCTHELGMASKYPRCHFGHNLQGAVSHDRACTVPGLPGRLYVSWKGPYYAFFSIVLLMV